MGCAHKTLLLDIKACNCFELPAELAVFFHNITVLLERTSKIFQTWVFCRYFLKHKPSKTFTSKKTKDQFVANDKI